jgi:hypothetical protein
MTREITATVAGDRGMRSHRPSARHDIPCERRYSGRCEEVATEPACLVMQFVQGETFHARLERGPLPQHDGMGLGQAIASGLTLTPPYAVHPTVSASSPAGSNSRKCGSTPHSNQFNALAED